MQTIVSAMFIQKSKWISNAHFRDKNEQLHPWQNWTDGFFFYQIYKIDRGQLKYSRDIKGGEYRFHKEETVSVEEFRKMILSRKMYIVDEVEKYSKS